MPQPTRRTIAEQVGIQLIEADVETGFALVDEAKSYFAAGQSDATSRVLQQAAIILVDIEHRLGGLGEVASRPFHPLVAELRKELAAVAREDRT